MSLRIKKFLDRRNPGLRMLAVFLGCVLVLQGLYRLLRGALWPLLVYKANASASVWIINALTPAENAVAQGDIITSPGVSIQIAPGCDGADALILLFSALAAAPIRLRHSLWGMLAGGAFLLACNLLRTVALYYTYKHRPELLEPMHSYVGQTFIILAGVLFFVFWVSTWTRDHEAQSRP